MEAQTEDQQVKKGNRTWSPASKLGKLNGPEGHRMRWCDSDPANLQKKMEEGWEVINSTKYPQYSQSGSAINRAKDGAALDGSVRYREMIGMALAPDLYESRCEYLAQETEMNTRARIQGNLAKKELGKFSNKITSSINVGGKIKITE